MLKTIEADILTNETGNIVQQVNCFGVMRSGFAKAVKEKYPFVEKEYLAYCASKNPLDLLGDVLRVSINPNLNILNVFGQYTYGKSPHPTRHTEYAALRQAFQKIVDGTFLASNNVLYFPHRFGSDRGGGDWNIVESLIERYFPHAIIYKLPTCTTPTA